MSPYLGHQGRFKSFPVQRDEHLLTVLRYIERNALSAGQVKRPQDWRWGSLWTRSHGSDTMKPLLSDWPVDRPRDWVARVNAAISRRELEKLETSLKRGRPYGDDAWITTTARRLRLGHTIRDEGRPRKTTN